MEYYFDDIGILRYIIDRLNSTIELYGQVDVGFVKRLIELKSETEIAYTDYRIGWIKSFSEKDNVEVKLEGSKWVFKFILPEPKELE